jgi:hypothetical protein
MTTMLLGKLGIITAVALLSPGGGFGGGAPQLAGDGSAAPPDGGAAPSGVNDDDGCGAALGTLVVRPEGSYGRLTSGTVEVSGEGGVVAAGAVNTAIAVPTGCALTLTVRLDDLVDRPTVRRTGIVVGAAGDVRTVPVRIATGQVRVLASRDGRQVAGVARVRRAGAAREAGTLGANGAAREISAGAWSVAVEHRGESLAGDVTVPAGQTRLVRLEG